MDWRLKRNFSGTMTTQAEWMQNLDSLKESVRLASSYNWNDIDLSHFQGNVSGNCRT